MSIELFDNLVMLKVVMGGTEILPWKSTAVHGIALYHIHMALLLTTKTGIRTPRAGEGGVIDTVSCTFTFYF